jgi:hypothetical protein
MLSKKLDEGADLIQGIMEVSVGSGVLFLGSVMAVKFNEKAMHSIAITYPTGISLFYHGIQKIKGYQKQKTVEVNEVSEFYSLPDHTIWDNLPNRVYSIE